MIARYCVAAIALLASAAAANPFEAKTSERSAQSAYMAKLVGASRRLGGDDDGAAAEMDVDLTGHSLRFEKCQFVKAYNNEFAEDDYDTVLETERFVIFRLCPTGSCSSCNSGYGEYIVDMATYLDATVELYSDEQEEMCETCNEQCYYENQNQGDDAANAANGDDQANRRLSDSVNCSSCMTECEKIDNMEDNYYLDATTMINCQQIREAGDDDGTIALYGGPICASQGSKIKIGVFLDNECNFLDSSLDVENFLTNEDGYAMKLSHALLKKTYDTSECIDCLADQDDDAAEAEAKDICMNIYEEAGKCESYHGFDYGMAYANADDGEFENQIANEELVCDFISSLKSGTYSQDGEIIIGSGKSTVYRKSGTATTGGQKFALTFFIIGTVGLAVYAAMLHSQLTKGGKSDLSAQGGAMA